VKPPYVEEISTHCGSFNGGTHLTLRGRRLGQSPLDVLSVSVGGFACSNVVWLSSNELHCQTPAIDTKRLQIRETTSKSVSCVINQHSCLQIPLILRSLSKRSWEDAAIVFPCSPTEFVCCSYVFYLTHAGHQARFNQRIPQSRNNIETRPVKAVTVTVMNQHKLVLANPLVEDDRSEHAHTVFRSLLNAHLPYIHQSVVNLAVYVDDVSKFSKGFVFCTPVFHVCLQISRGV
jgi:hypothetical protein